MTTVVLTSEHEMKSARKLGYPVTMHHGELEEESTLKVIRWGNGYGREFRKTLNKGSCIALNVDKPAALEKMAEVVQTPAVFTGRVPRGLKVVIRPMTHSMGEDFRVVTGPTTVPSGYYAKEWIESTKEYRCWFANGRTLAAKRVPMPDSTEEANPCRSKWGYSFIDSDGAPKLRTETLAAARAMGLDFGASDVIWSQDDEKYFFLEMNTAPSLDHDKVLSFFQTNLKAMLTAL